MGSFLYYLFLSALSSFHTFQCGFGFGSGVSQFLYLGFLCSRENIEKFRRAGSDIFMNSSKNATFIANRSFSSYVVSGLAIGRTIGFPTINLAPPKTLSITHGVYGCFITKNNARFDGILYFGPNYLEDNMMITLETHILFKPSQDQRLLKHIVPGTKISVTITRFIRTPRKIASKRALKKLIANDIHILTNASVNSM